MRLLTTQLTNRLDIQKALIEALIPFALADRAGVELSSEVGRIPNATGPDTVISARDLRAASQVIDALLTDTEWPECLRASEENLHRQLPIDRDHIPRLNSPDYTDNTFVKDIQDVEFCETEHV